MDKSANASPEKQMMPIKKHGLIVNPNEWFWLLLQCKELAGKHYD